jgi:hypothetical protein
MNLNLKKHNLLELLSKQSVNFDLGKTTNFSVSITIILKKLDINEFLLYPIISELIVNKEIDYYFWNEIEKKGLFATPLGVSSYSNKKYKKLFFSNIRNNSKDLVQIIIPIVSLLITLLIVKDNLSKESKYNTQVKELKERIEKLESRGNTLKISSEKKNQNNQQKK